MQPDEQESLEDTKDTKVKPSSPKIFVITILVCLVVFGSIGFIIGRLSSNPSQMVDDKDGDTLTEPAGITIINQDDQTNPIVTNVPTSQTDIPNVTNASPSTAASTTIVASNTFDASTLTKTWTNQLVNKGATNIFSTSDWNYFSPINDIKIKFSIKYPSNWINSGGQTFEKDGVKVAEMVGVINLRNGSTCFEGLPQSNFVSDSGFYNTFISQSAVSFNGKTGFKRIVSVSEDGFNKSEFNTIHYCIYSDTSQALYMNFSYKKTETTPEAVYQGILQSFSSQFYP